VSPSESDSAGWRGVVDSYGGFKVFGVAALAVVVVAAIVFREPLGFGSASDDLPVGEVVVLPETVHVPDGTLGPNPPLTPAGGPHYPLPLRQGIYDQPVPDGNAIHSLEHGMVWVSYQPDLVSAEVLLTLEEIATDFDLDVLLSPRLENSSPVIVVSWGRRLVLDDLDEEAVRAFVTTNRNKSPEPGLR
jgi:hypothetical protein